MSRPGPANYTANVNRAKTKKWVEAKSYSYDGDDWGDVDDYDEYGGYDEPEPQPVQAAKPTGLRQRGQSASQMPQEAYGDRQELYQSPVDGRQQYDNLPGAPPQQQQQRYGSRSFTNPQHPNKSALMRSNSFDRDDERRTFSAGGPQRRDPTDHYTAPPPQAQNTSARDFEPMQQPHHRPDQILPAAASPPLHLHSQPSTEGLAGYGDQTRSPGGNHGVGSDFNQPRQPNMGSRAPSMTSSTSAMDFHDRRDFSPSAMPPPLQTRGSPSPHSPDRNSSSRPPRKSSLGQSGGPVQKFPSNTSQMPVSRDQEDETSRARDRAGSGTGKPLPFVRPADIYKRMHEEKEKERQSQDSSRPSMDSILGGASDCPGLGKRQESESSQRLKPILDPVKERKSEYGMEGVHVQEEKTPDERRSTSSKTFEFPKRASNVTSQAPENAHSPMLPDVSRVSGFGESFFGTTNRSSNGSQDFALSAAEPSHEGARQPAPSAPEKSLQHQPSLGFTSAVHQAFDKAEDQVPPTPSSTQGSSVGRSTSAGTSTVSPIISRGPSTATENWNSRLPGIDSVSTPMIPEGPEGGSPRPISSESLGTPTQLVRKPSPTANNPPPEAPELPPSFIPGYRRNSDTPSPDNSPRRTPALETNRQLRQPQEVEIAAATPTDPGFSTSSSSQVSEVSQESPVKDHVISGAANEDHSTAKNVPSTLERSAENMDTGISPISPSHERLRDRTDSSSSGRVRNLADKFESSSRPGSAHSSTPRASVLAINAQKKDDLVPLRPLADRMESFRPHLPGGWESSASIAPVAIPGVSQDVEARHPSDLTDGRGFRTTDATHEGKVDEIASTSDQRPSAVTQVKDASEEAFAAVTAAGNALAGAFGNSLGMNHPDTSQAPASNLSPLGKEQREKGHDSNSPVRNQGALYPEASKQQMSGFGDEESSTGAPTPLPKDHTLGSAKHAEESDYFEPTSAPRSFEDGAKPNNGGRALKPPPALPLLSTGSTPQQYESDRLRKEIVRELTPMSASEPTTGETDFSSYQQTPSPNASVSRPGHESGVFPREYESYWNDAASDDGMNDLGDSPNEVGDADRAKQQHGSGDIEPLQPGQEHEPMPSLTSPENISRQISPMLPHRFSWEQPLQDLPSEPEPLNEQPAGPSSGFLENAVYPEGHFSDRDEPSKFNQPPPLSSDSDPIANTPHHMPEKDLPVRGSNELLDARTEHLGQDKEVAGDPSSLELATSPTGLPSNGPPVAEREVRRQEVGSQGFEILSSERQEPDPSRLEQPVPDSSGSPMQPLDPSLIPPPATAPPKIPAFREILALKSPADRIQAYNESREQFANMNTGLAHWLAMTLNDLPEHADLLANSGRGPLNLQGHKPSPSRSKLGGLLPSGGQAGHQPYFQQYLNASPQPATSDGIALGGNVGGGSSPGFASGRSGSKLSSQQVQAKGKDLLQSAGVFGGKANVAAKGLFSKGKSKLRAASGNEKAFSRLPSSAEPSSGIQQPASRAQALPPAKPPTDLPGSLRSVPKPNAPSEVLHSSRVSQSRSSQSTPSIVSVTQSQLGDDEFSEESEPTSQEHPPRASSLYLKQHFADMKGSHVVQKGTAGRDHHETSSPFSHVGSPKEVHTPRSVTSSNQTPTQATFPHDSPPRMSPDTPGPVRRSFVPREEAERPHASEHEPAHPDQFSSTQLSPATQVPYSLSNLRSSASDRNGPGTGLAKEGSYQNSTSTIRNVNSKDAISESPDKSSNPPNLRNADLDRISRAPERMHALAASEVSSSATNAPTTGTNRYRVISTSSTRNKLDVPRLSQDFSIRDPTIDGLPGHYDHDRPASPVSLHHPNNPAETDQRGRNGPIHYGLDHDFVPNSDGNRRSRSRPQSRARPTQRSSIHDNGHDEIGGEPPPSSYSGQISREQSPMLRQQAPEYQIEGASPPLEWPSESKSRSRRGSRSSAFFKSLSTGTSSKQEEPPLPLSPDYQPTSSPVNSPTPAKRDSKRAGMFRSLTGNSGSGSASGPSKDLTDRNTSMSDARQRSQTAAVEPLPPVEDDEFPSRGKSQSAGSKLSKKLQRASTSSKTEQNGDKKKRFSAIGSLFGRGASKRQSSSNKSTSGPQTQGLSPRTSNHFSKPSAPPTPNLQDWYTPPKDNYHPPPPGGYYAPRPAQVDEAPLPSNSIAQPYGQASPWLSNTPAYVQDTSLRRQYDQQKASPIHQPDHVTPRSSSTFPQRSRQQSLTSVPRSSTADSSTREAFPQRLSEENRGSGGAWTRFSQHGRNKSRQDHSRTPSHFSQQASPQEIINHASLPRANSHHKYQYSYHAPSRSESPPPPPPPPKDDWNQPRAHESTADYSTAQSSTPRQIPSQATARPYLTQTRQSLPPLQTSMTGNRRSGAGSGETLTPEEKRKSRQQQIENSTLKPQSPVFIGTKAAAHQMREPEEEPVVMSATSFPGQEWQPAYAHWDGD